MSSLNEARFYDLVETTQQAVEDILDQTDLDLDVENSGGILTVRFENGTQIIFSRQPPLRQLWVAARSGGYHFDYDEASGQWICDSTKEPLGILLSRVTREQIGDDVDFSPL
ncbi:CyaY protein [Pseudomonas duriflava]|uniref:Iron-sulfur cluster assembly protein CyaY n=1 Tax=Pseudomonas duriflava TaxID=459528 RepID=A0A562QLC4_9PSED|nr:iron donor protein CyaY [Pseudomonas duriflava]TWI57524.1 CyaY protein [Pseudomonas duriflava]